MKDVIKFFSEIYREFNRSIFGFLPEMEERTQLSSETNDRVNIIDPSRENLRILQYDKLHFEARNLFMRKNADYGDSFSVYGPLGVIIRIGDKITRLNTINKKTIITVDDETLRDTLIDLHNYAAMAIMLMDE